MVRSRRSSHREELLAAQARRKAARRDQGRASGRGHPPLRQVRSHSSSSLMSSLSSPCSLLLSVAPCAVLTLPSPSSSAATPSPTSTVLRTSRPSASANRAQKSEAQFPDLSATRLPSSPPRLAPVSPSRRATGSTPRLPELFLSSPLCIFFCSFASLVHVFFFLLF